MKTLLKLAIPLVVVFAFITQCDSVEPKVENTDDTEQIELIAPANSATDQSINVDLVWKQIKGAKVYELMVSETENFESAAIDTVIETDSFENGSVSASFKTPALKRETTYYWKVFPVKENKAGPWSEVWNFTTRESEADPGAVDLMSPEDGITLDEGEISFEWGSMDDVENYTYQVAVDADFTELVVDTLVAESSISLNDLEPGAEYLWRVAPELESETGPWSETWGFEIDVDDGSDDGSDDPANPKVTLTSPENGGSDLSANVDFTWEEESGYSEYDYQLSNDESFDSVIIEETVSGTSYTAEELSNNEDYFWRVKVAGSGDEWSDVWEFSTENALPDAVTLTSPADFSFDVSTEPEFIWEELTGYNEYEYQLSDDNSFSNIIVEETVSGTSFTPEGLDYEKEYYWRVKVAGEYDNWSDAWSLTTEEEPYTAPPASGEFVTTQNSNFMLDGQIHRFAGTNAYYLPNYEKINSGVVDRAFDLFEDSGVTVVRMWGFYDGYDCGYSRNDSNENVIQTAPGEYSEEALRDLDNVIAKGKEHGVKFIIPFVNYWDELGGLCQYNTWAGASNPSENMDFFINNSETQKWYKDYIDMLLNRVNTVTGVAYKDEPAIMAWQLVNEGRNSGANPQVLRDWYQEIAQFVKSIDSNHLVGTGEEGFDEGTPSEYTVDDYSNTYVLRSQNGTSYLQNTAIPEIDFGSAHWYPNEWGFGTDVGDNTLTAQSAWLRDHQRIAENENKPFLIGEFGFPGSADDRVHKMYDDLYEQAESIELDGNLLWQLVADGTKCWEFGGNICYPEGRADTDLYNKFKQHITNMRNLK
ncbi:MAG: cellulase family glycosylhydrolase [Balneolaceae bacterium]